MTISKGTWKWEKLTFQPGDQYTYQDALGRDITWTRTESNWVRESGKETPVDDAFVNYQLTKDHLGPFPQKLTRNGEIIHARDQNTA